MTLQMATSGEALSTAVTAVGSFACVRAHVPFQGTGLGEWLATDLTGEWAFSCVESTVFLEVLKQCKRLVAFTALVHALWLPEQITRQ